MLINDTKIRIRYGEVDMMGFLYHSHYIELFDVGRTELMRKYNVPYIEMEANNIMMPVLQVHIDYINAAHYDDVVTVRTMVRSLPTAVRIKFEYEVYRSDTPDIAVEEQQLITKGSVTLSFMNATTHRPTRCPSSLLEVIQPYF